MIGLKRGSVKLVKHNSGWSKSYQKEREQLAEVLIDEIVGIEHIGSTAIPGILAKPVIDMEIGIRSIEDLRKVERIASKLKKLNYEWKRMNSVPDHHLFVKGPEKMRTFYLHLVEHEGQIWKKDLLFRDFLNDNRELATQYEKLKENLAKKYARQRESYTKGKKDFIENVLKIAKGL